jgi:hypothetical protein
MTEWTPDQLYEHFRALRETDREAVATALAAAKEAVVVAEHNAEKWRDSANEWRDAMNDRERDFLRRSEVRAFLFAVIGAGGTVVAIAVAISR